LPPARCTAGLESCVLGLRPATAGLARARPHAQCHDYYLAAPCRLAVCVGSIMAKQLRACPWLLAASDVLRHAKLAMAAGFQTNPLATMPRGCVPVGGHLGCRSRCAAMMPACRGAHTRLMCRGRHLLPRQQPLAFLPDVACVCTSLPAVCSMLMRPAVAAALVFCPTPTCSFQARSGSPMEHSSLQGAPLGVGLEIVPCCMKQKLLLLSSWRGGYEVAHATGVPPRKLFQQ